MTDSLQFVSAGVLLGLSAGVTPGPLLTLVLTETIRHNRIEGFKVAVSPLITDLPIIVVATLLFSTLSQFNLALAVISILGGIFIAFLGVESLRIKDVEVDLQGAKSGSLKKGIMANFLNPSPYLFWATVGVPLVFKAYQVNVLTVVLFFGSFYTLLIGSKVLIAFLVDRTKSFLNPKVFKVVIRILGIALLLFSLVFFYDGIKFLL